MNPQIFQNTFFARSMHQMFNGEVIKFISDETEPALRKWLRASGRLS